MSIFNPYVMLGILLAILSAAGSGYYKGQRDEVTRQQLEIAELNTQARAKERALISAVTTQATKLQKANYDAKIAAKERDAAIASGNLKLRLPVKTPVCPVQTAGDPAPAAGDSVQTGGELDATTAQSLVAITDQGDANTRQLNACIDAYNTVYQTLKSRP
jgi:type II secretory pathway pseudopilin PulG